MATEVVFPMLGITVEKGAILKWMKGEGARVEKGEPIFEVEADKVTTEVESPATGILGKILVPEGVEIPVLTVVGIILQEGERLPDRYAPSPVPSSVGEAPQEGLREPARAAVASRGGDAYDVAIIGAGVGGYVAAIRAAQLGARVLLLEKERLGGTCLNWGCIPTKCFLSDVKPLARIKASPVYMGKNGLSIDLRQMLARKDHVVKTMTRGVAKLVEANGIHLVKGTATCVDPRHISVSGPAGTETHRARNVIVATGSRPGGIPKVSVDGKAVLSSDHALGLQKVPKRLIIIGGGVIGVEFACIFNALGTQVTVVEMLPAIIPTEDDDIVRGMTLLLQRQGIEILTEARVLGVSGVRGGIAVKVAAGQGKDERLTAEKVLLAVGRTPCTDGLDLGRLGLRMDGKFIEVNGRMETNVDGVYAVGDVIGKSMLAHAASAEGIVAAENIFGKSREMDYGRVPICMYTFPEVASVGLRERDARAQGLDVRVGRFPYLNSGKAMAMGEPEGFVKIIAEKGLGRIVGVHILGEHATDLIGEGLLAMSLEAAVEDLGGVIKGHPTLSEAVMEAALDGLGRAIHMPPRAE